MKYPPVKWTDEDRASWRYRTRLLDERDTYRGRDCLVVACGPSAEPYADEIPRYWSITCNRAARWGGDFTAAFEPRKDVELWPTIREAPCLLSHIPRDHGNVIITPPKQDIRPWFMRGTLPPGRPLAFGQSPFFAIAAALALGFETVGVIGLDMTPDRYRTRSHLYHANAAYVRLTTYAEAMGRRIVNLSPASRVEALPKGPWTKVRPKTDKELVRCQESQG